MRTRFRLPALAVLLGGLLFLFAGGTSQAILVIFKDGFVLQGRVVQEREPIVDSASGQVFSVPVSGALYVIDDDTRRILFSPSEVLDVRKDPGKDATLITIKLEGRPGRDSLNGAKVAAGDTTPWDAKWHRSVWRHTAKAKYPVEERVNLLTPEVITVISTNYSMYERYKTQEWAPETVRGLLTSHYAKQKTSAVKTTLEVARFFLQAGWVKEAEGELKGLKTSTSEQEEAAKTLREDIQRVKAVALGSSIELAWKVGQPQEARDRLNMFYKENMDDLVGEKQQSRLQELKTKIDATEERIGQALRLLKDLPGKLSERRRSFFKQAADVIAEELNPETLPRLVTFFEQAGAYELALKNKRQPKQDVEAVLAFALSGWLLGNDAAEEKVETAVQLWEMRKFVLEYQRTHESTARTKMQPGMGADKLGPDVVARLIRNLPPPDAPEKTDTKVTQMTATPPQGLRGVNYVLQLPPEYQRSRAYPVLFVLHRGGERAEDALEKWSDLASRHGYILAAPVWDRGGGGVYRYTEDEHAAVLDCLRDLRRLFQVNSDRVFLFGSGQGGAMAYDVGLAHPDLFAGVMVMSMPPAVYSIKYWPNGQLLPFYVVDGSQSGGKSAENNRIQFKKWIPAHHPVLFFEYRGRGGDWFAAELPNMMTWMQLKKRAHPMTELGTRHEYLTMRSGDNHFYWLSTDALAPRALNGKGAAELKANITPGNRIDVDVKCVKQVTVWLGPGMVKFGEKATVRLNQRTVGSPMLQPSLTTLLEDFYERGDRQQQFLAKIDLSVN